MKTKEEQIIKMANIIKNDYKQWLDVTGVFPEGSSYYFECLGGGFDCARLLYEAGYGDVSEYKAEIERLKADIESLKEDYEFVRECDNKHFLELTEKVKQAQIDVLNTARTHCVHCDQWNVDVLPEPYIDELIKEVQNGKDKG